MLDCQTPSNYKGKGQKDIRKSTTVGLQVKQSNQKTNTIFLDNLILDQLTLHPQFNCSSRLV